MEFVLNCQFRFETNVIPNALYIDYLLFQILCYFGNYCTFKSRLDTIAHLANRPCDLSNKIIYKKRHHFLSQFSTSFHMLCSVLLIQKVLASKTIEYKLPIGCQRISTSQKLVFWANTCNKTDHTMWKSIENCARKWCLFLCTILFEVTW